MPTVISQPGLRHVEGLLLTLLLVAYVLRFLTPVATTPTYVAPAASIPL